MTVGNNALYGSELFKRLDDTDIEAVCQTAKYKAYEAGQNIFTENEEAYAVCVLLDGRVGLQMEVGNQRQLLVSTLDSGEVFAWSGLVAPFNFTATAKAMVDCEVAIFKSEDLTRLFEERPRLGYHVMTNIAVIMGERLRDSHLQLLGLFGA
jgi:CRP/FNR family cyclic AMP-dependent transcriptional regulator